MGLVYLYVPVLSCLHQLGSDTSLQRHSPLTEHSPFRWLDWKKVGEEERNDSSASQKARSFLSFCCTYSSKVSYSTVTSHDLIKLGHGSLHRNASSMLRPAPDLPSGHRNIQRMLSGLAFRKQLKFLLVPCVHLHTPTHSCVGDWQGRNEEREHTAGRQGNDERHVSRSTSYLRRRSQ